MFEHAGLNAFSWGIISAVSLPLGAIIGLLWKPKQIVNSSFMAFGAGALLFALTIELFGHVPHHVQGHGNMALWAALGGALAGGFLFDALNTILNNQGAFLRKFSQAKRYIAHLKFKRTQELIDKLASIDVLNSLNQEDLKDLTQNIRTRTYRQGEVLFQEGDASGALYFIASGRVHITLKEAKKEVSLTENETFGEIGVLLDIPRTGTAEAETDLILYEILKSDLQEFVKEHPSLTDPLARLAEGRLDEISMTPKKSSSTAGFSIKDFFLHEQAPVSHAEVAEESAKHGSGGNAAMAIWLGIFIDGIPESLIIGMLALNPSGMSLAFIAGVFLANLPEAMSSAVSMRRGGMRYAKIMMMWGSLCIFTGIGAWLGAEIFPAQPEGNLFYLVLGIEGLAAGAMLTMIAETMLPEAFEQGGRIVGMSTLLGFLAALIVKILGG